MTRTLSLVLLALTSTVPRAHAQTLSSVMPLAVGIGFVGLSAAAIVRLSETTGTASVGSEIRFATRDEPGRVRGRVTAITADSIELATDSANAFAALRFARSGMYSVELYQGVERRWAPGWRRGLIIGASLAATASVLSAVPVGCTKECVNFAGATPLFAVAGAVGGSVIGALLGATYSEERWVHVTGLAAPSIALSPTESHGVGLLVKVPF
jgi:hypothetical protein